ncbi:MAG: hypothetical protein AAGA41_08575 [Pseudomonadota bacterium]
MASLSRTTIPDSERDYVSSGIAAYDSVIESGTEQARQLVAEVTSSALHYMGPEEIEYLANKTESAKVELPSVCEVPDVARARLAILMAERVLQRYAHVVYTRGVEYIARSNKSNTLEEEGIQLSDWMLDARSIVTLASVYGVPATTNGLPPDGFVVIEIAQEDYTYSRATLPEATLPKQAREFLHRQFAIIQSYESDLLALAELGGAITIQVDSPESVDVFNEAYWAEHISWQIAARNTYSPEDSVSLRKSDYSTYGLR